MKTITEKQAINLLKKYSTDKNSFANVLAHSRKVQELAVSLAKRIQNANVDFVRIAAILHDIGRFNCPVGRKTIWHGVEGAKILRKEGLRKYALVAERHLGVGISKEDIKRQKLPLPLKDYMPKTIEEKIISYADNLLFGSRIGTIQEVIKRFEKEVSPFYAKKIIKLHNELMKLSGSKNIIHESKKA